MSKQSISQPSHQFLTLSDGTQAYVFEDKSGVEITAPKGGPALLDANDAVRLAAFLNRYYAEQNQAAQRAQSQADRRLAAKMVK